MTKPTFAVHTMGCKLNFYDTEAMAAGLEECGFQRGEDWQTADLAILNTCTVTNASDSESRNLIRKYRRRNQNGFLVVTGCYAQAKASDIRAMEEVDLVTTNVDKYKVIQPIVGSNPKVVVKIRTNGPDPVVSNGFGVRRVMTVSGEPVVFVH